MDFDIAGVLLRFLALLPALTLHEFAHAYSATRCGDPTAAAYGRVTLNPLAHLDPIGTLMILFGPIGWAKPVPINPANFRRPTRDIIITSAVGPLSNLAQGVVCCLLIRGVMLAGGREAGLIVSRVRDPGVLGVVLGVLAFMVLINFCLCIFNLIPLGPLDGHHIMEYALPYQQAVRYRAFNHQYGFAVLIGLILLSNFTNIGIFTYVMYLPAILLGSLLSGAPRWSLTHLIS